MKKVIRRLVREGLNITTLNNGVLYHGSKYPKIKWGASIDDYGTSLNGYGIYLTTSVIEARDYALTNTNEGYLFTLNVSSISTIDFWNQVPHTLINKIKGVDNFLNLLEVKFNEEDFDIMSYEYELGNITYSWDYFGDEKDPKLMALDNNWQLDKYVGIKHTYESEKNLGLKNIKDIIKNFNDVGTEPIYHEESNTEISLENIFSSFHNLYIYTSIKYNSLKKASLFFKDMGIDAFIAKSVGTDNFYPDDNDFILCVINSEKISNIKGKKIELINTKEVEYNKR